MSTPPADKPDARRDPLISITGQTGDVKIGDVAGGDIHKPTIAPGGIYAPYGTVHQPFIPRPVDATPDELTAAQHRLAALPTDAVPPAQDTLPPGSWLAQLTRNQQFVGREADLLTLARALKGGQSVAVNQAASAVASGLGGIGKTQLAIEFAYRYGNHFAGVYWLNFAQAGTIEAEIAACGGAGRLQLFTEAAGLKLDEQVNLVQARWACGLPYLLIFDNCEDPQLVRKHHPGGTTRVLITSRTPDWPGDLGVQRHALGVLQRDESIALLRQHRPALSDAEAEELADELGDLPLALHLAGRFLAGPGKNLAIKRYIDELCSPRIFERLPVREQDGALPTGHNRDVARTFALSYERLDSANSEDELALKLLARMAHLVPGEVVPAALLQATLALPADDLDAELSAEAALDRLVALGLVEREGDEGLRMHRLVGVYVRQVSDDAEAQGAVERVVIDAAKNLVDAPTLAPIAAFLPLLRGVTDAAMGREDESAAMLCNWLGRHLKRHGDYAAARPLYERALAIRERVLGAQHPDTATSLNNLAGLHYAQGNYAAARPLYERAFAINERVLGAVHPATAISLNNLAGLLSEQRDYARALPLYERALAINAGVLGAEHPETARSLSNLALLHQHQGNYDAARSLGERALAICERVLGAEHPQTAVSLNNLAGLFDAQGDYAAARPLYERALTIYEQVLGYDHPETATVLHNLAVVHSNQGDVAAAIQLIERVLSIRRRVLGPEHPDTISAERRLEMLHGAGSPLLSELLALLPFTIAMIAIDDDMPRDVAMPLLPLLEAQSRDLLAPVERIWAGERDAAALTQGLDAHDTALIERILALIAELEG